MRIPRIGRSIIASTVILGASTLSAQTCQPEDAVGVLTSVKGIVETLREDADWRPAALHEPICPGDTVRTGSPGSAQIDGNGWFERLDQNSAIRIGEAAEAEGSILDQLYGIVLFFSRSTRDLEVVTPFMNAAVEGTEFVVQVQGAQTEVIVIEGRVVASNDVGEVTLDAGAAAVAQAGRAPEPRIVVRPRESVAWSIFYPPILGSSTVDGSGDSSGLPEALREAGRYVESRDYVEAFDALVRVTEADHDAQFFNLRAALLLAVGQVDEAGADIERALADDPQAGLAYALRAVIAVAQNNVNEALADASRAVELAPRSAAAKIALSYAQQAGFDLLAARDSMQQAIVDEPENALAWARLAETWLALGYRGRAREAAASAVFLDPNEPRAQIVLGFASLSEIRTDDAAASFERAIELDSTDPLPRLGLGLARINNGELESGRQQIEIAVGLDPSNALSRAYLAKAYFEERRSPLDAEQLAIAKALDPNDPTAFLYDGIRLQTENRPVQAIRNLQQSIDRNDNRAVFRSRLQLDADRAVRGANLARAYHDLGFGRLAINEAHTVLSDDPSNASAHRFVADAYRGTRRREIARVSELLQAQLLQDININPIQPSISAINLNIGAGGGTAQAGVNEFTPLFERNQVRVNASLAGGNNGMSGGEAIVSAIHNRFSFSAGAFRFATDGYRPNSKIEHEIVDVFGQMAVTPKLNIQAELRVRDSEFGDLELNFDPGLFDAHARHDLDQDMARVGLRFSPAPGSDLIVSLIRNGRVELIDGSAIDVIADDDGHQADVQYVFRGDRFNLTAGLSDADVDRTLSFSADDFVTTFASESRISHPRAYAYVNVSFPKNVRWTAGLSHDNYREDSLEVGGLSPKLGLQWDITQKLRLRAASFRTVKPALVSNRTIEPTQVAGFTQLFDDVNAAESKFDAIALDWRASANLSFGAEATWREVDVPVFINAGSELQREDEELHRVYVNWTPTEQLAITAEVEYDQFEGRQGSLATFGVIPQALLTRRVPVALRYFHPNGFFAGIGVDHVRQTLRRSGPLAPPDGSDEFVIVNVTAGYRLPNRRGTISLEVRNLRDTEFNYQDDSFREFGDEPATGPYIPERTIVLRASAGF